MNFKRELAAALAKCLNINEELESAIEIPPSPEMGDFAFPCFRLAKTLKKAPPAIAQELELALKNHGMPSFIADVKIAGAYLNFYVCKKAYAKEVIQEALEKGENYGKTNAGNGKTVVIDFSSPNIAKPFHVGHLRSTVIGHSLYRLYSACGYNCVGINHLGDWGTQFGKLMVAYRLWGSGEEDITSLNKLYVKFHEEAKENPALDDEARHWLIKMQDGDEEALSLWRRFHDISMKEFDAIYKRLGVTFDSTKGESFYTDYMPAVVEELKQKSLLEESEGAMVVNLEDAKMSPCLILRRDGGSLYPTRDIAAALYRKKTYNFDLCLYITAFDQNLHFAQWFKVVEKMGYPWATNLVHVPFGLVTLETGKLSTRAGNVVLMEDLLNESVKKTADIIQEKNPNLENKDEVAAQVGIGAVIFHDLYNNRIKDVVFSWERMLSFEGETGPYVQYAHARACSVLLKATDNSTTMVDFDALTDDASFETIKTLSGFSDKIMAAASKNEPYIVARFLVALAQSFNRFYHENPILTSEGPTREARLALVRCVKQVLAAGLTLLGMESPEKM